MYAPLRPSKTDNAELWHQPRSTIVTGSQKRPSMCVTNTYLLSGVL